MKGLPLTGNIVPSTILIDNKIINKDMTIMVLGFEVGLSWNGIILKFK